MEEKIKRKNRESKKFIIVINFFHDIIIKNLDNNPALKELITISIKTLEETIKNNMKKINIDEIDDIDKTDENNLNNGDKFINFIFDAIENFDSIPGCRELMEREN